MTWRVLYHGSLEGCDKGKGDQYGLTRMHLINFGGSPISSDLRFSSQKSIIHISLSFAQIKWIVTQFDVKNVF